MKIGNVRGTSNKKGITMLKEFSRLPIGTAFTFGGTEWVKKSTRTAYVKGLERFFYFGLRERVTQCN